MARRYEESARAAAAPLREGDDGGKRAREIAGAEKDELILKDRHRRYLSLVYCFMVVDIFADNESQPPPLPSMPLS
jgi:hypothetical protein